MPVLANVDVDVDTSSCEDLDFPILCDFDTHKDEADRLPAFAIVNIESPLCACVTQGYMCRPCYEYASSGKFFGCRCGEIYEMNIHIIELL